MNPSSKAENKPPIRRLDVIGANLVGAKHAAIAASLPSCRLVGIADPNPAARHLADDLSTRCYNDYQEMISAEIPDGVIIATPTERHVPVGIACTERGEPLLVGHHRRFNPPLGCLASGAGSRRAEHLEAKRRGRKPNDV